MHSTTSPLSLRSLAVVFALLPVIALAHPTATPTPTNTASPAPSSSAPASTAATTSTLSVSSTITGTPAYCTTAPPQPKFDIPTGTTRPVPPLPCTGAYDAEKGLCCKSTDPNCSGGGVEWQLPLAPCVTSNPLYRGCPGNMLNNVCCESARVAFVDGKVSCENGRSLFMVMTSADKTVTSSFGPAITTPGPSSSQTPPSANPGSGTIQTTTKTGGARMPAPTGAAPVAAILGMLGAVAAL
ncbi:hypothetical protein MCOR07_008665 [Pyricularia oryzae]|uniref:Uncharacterized protein n=1 Tax=Pyricularia grisea TaxID=148305 RepID=A0ABQ8N492_PYRGI|nr:hypothetical protein MCOR33_010967 [Pyricularia grisea]KAI6315636.1 hypothetical protein MCOR30_009619 [Pyricularia oryzae]KAI6319452.1 hypothetical protein MCOR29_005548 [Pyricularia oryzae]KAI6448150.1 hypothetical protein MCOR15_010022 [Pyricularia oryzae]KAI6499403.1 hypothetical protein MCOR13_006321 [Pyricularia oryzae]